MIMSERTLALLCLLIAAANCARVKQKRKNIAEDIQIQDEVAAEEKRIGNFGDNPFGNMFGGGAGGGNPFGGGGAGGGNPFGNMFGGGGDNGPIVPMTDLDAKAIEPKEYPQTPDCFTADVQMKMSMLPIVIPGKLYYNSPENRVKMDQGHGAYILERYDLSCKVKAKPQSQPEVEAIPEGEKISTFQLPPKELTKWQGTETVGGVKCYRYFFNPLGLLGDVTGSDFKIEVTLWVSAKEPHFPVYMKHVMTMPQMGPMTTEQHLSKHVGGCNFADSLWDDKGLCKSLNEPSPEELARQAAELKAKQEAERKAKEEEDQKERDKAMAAEMEKRLAANKAKKGALTISLLWDQGPGADMDLHVLCPGGHISYSSKKQCGGELDVDKQSGAKDPVENVYFKSPPKGTYKVYVHNYSKKPVKSFKVIIDNLGEKQFYTGQVGFQNSPGVLVKEFSI